jgi:hypothetical protein
MTHGSIGAGSLRDGSKELGTWEMQGKCRTVVGEAAADRVTALKSGNPAGGTPRNLSQGQGDSSLAENLGCALSCQSEREGV